MLVTVAANNGILPPVWSVGVCAVAKKRERKKEITNFKEGEIPECSPSKQAEPCKKNIDYIPSRRRMKALQGVPLNSVMTVYWMVIIWPNTIRKGLRTLDAPHNTHRWLEPISQV